MNRLHCPLYLTAGNFPSRAANTIQVAKMAAAYTRWLPDLEVVALTGLPRLCSNSGVDLMQFFGLSRPLNIRYLPLLWSQKELLFDQDYRPPKWFYSLVGHYANLRRAKLVFTRKPETAVVTVRKGLNTVLETHVPFERMPHVQKHLSILLRTALRALVVVTQPIAESFARAGFPANRILVEPDGVDLTQYSPKLERNVARAQLNIPERDFLCVYTGHLYRDRGIETVIEAAQYLPDVGFVLAGGWDRDVSYYRKLASDAGAANVTFTGFVPQALIPLYQFSADVLLMQYSAKTHHSTRCSPLKVFEYMAAGRPIVSTDLQVLYSVLHHERNCVMVKPDSASALARAIQRVMESPQLSQHIAHNARLQSAQFSWEHRARRILDHALGGN